MPGPQRTCVGCRRCTSPDELVRIVRSPDGRATLGRTLPGRGAWLCRGSAACFGEALRRNALPRALRGSLDPTSLADLEVAHFRA